MHDTLGIDRGFVVHANTHGFDNAVDLDAVARSEGRYLAVVRLDGRVSVVACRTLNGAAFEEYVLRSILSTAALSMSTSSITCCAAWTGWAGSSSCTSRARACLTSSHGSPASRRPC